MKHVEESIIPKIEEIKRMEQKVLALQDSLNRAQKEALRKQGYTRMTLEQANKFYVGDEELMQVIKEEESLEEMIHEMAEYKAPKRSKRQILQLRLLQPYAFVNKQLITSILGLNLLSPYAFYQTILAPKILSPDPIPFCLPLQTFVAFIYVRSHSYPRNFQSKYFVAKCPGCKSIISRRFDNQSFISISGLTKNKFTINRKVACFISLFIWYQYSQQKSHGHPDSIPIHYGNKHQSQRLKEA
ncbi:unnamed protein product [Bursaphelenchus xylophilus]|nr:unnamed protein product [Bursaphelenchus xylophilus]CAG9117153.1 unnamed protein product [Bursaphelenchus xylophilus]